MASVNATVAGEGAIALGEMVLSVDQADVAIDGEGAMATGEMVVSIGQADVEVIAIAPLATGDNAIDVTREAADEEIENVVEFDALGPLGEGMNTLTIDETVDATVQGEGPVATGDMEFTVLTAGDRSPFNVLRDDELLTGVEHLVKGPGVYVAAGMRRARRVAILDTSSPRTLRLARRIDESLAVTEELFGDVMELHRTDDHLFLYLFDGRDRWVEIRTNDLALTSVFREKVEGPDSEEASWIAVSEEADVFAYPARIGKVQLRRASGSFEEIGAVSSNIGNSKAAIWRRFTSQERRTEGDDFRVVDRRFFLFVIPEHGPEVDVLEYRKTEIQDQRELNASVDGNGPMGLHTAQLTVT